MKQIFKLIGFLSLVFFLGCEKETDSDIDRELDTIKIISVTPSMLLDDGIEYTFSVNIEYDLVTTNSGMLMIGFNTEEIDSYRMLSGATVIVDEGSGVHTFDVTTRVKDWKSYGSFKVYVNLSENPHPSSWYPLASDTMTLNFKD